MTRESRLLDELEQGWEEIRNELLAAGGGALEEMRAAAFRLSRRMPAVDVVEEETRYVLTVELPGVRKEDVRLEVVPSGVHIRAEKQDSQEEVRGNVVRKERSAERYERFVALPDEVSSEGTRARLRDGVLRIEVPKPDPSRRRAQQVEVES